MHIAIKGSPDSRMDLSLYRYKPRTIPLNIKPQAKRAVSELELQGVIRRMKANEQSKFCAPVGFVPKKSGKLRFVIDFTALNKYAQQAVHSFPSSDQVAQALKASTTHIAAIDFRLAIFKPCFTLILRT